MARHLRHLLVFWVATRALQPQNTGQRRWWETVLGSDSAVSPVPIEVYNAALKASTKDGEWRETSKILRTLTSTARRHRPLPNKETFALAGVAAARLASPRDARQILDQARHYGAASARLYTAVVGAYGRAKDRDTALDLFYEFQKDVEAKKMDDALDVQAFTAAVDACAAVGDWHNASKLHDAMRLKGVEPNARTYRGLCKAADFPTARQLLEEAIKAEHGKDLVPAFEAVFASLATGNTGKEVQDLLDVMEEKIFHGNVQEAAHEASRCYAHAVGAYPATEWRTMKQLLLRFESQFITSPTAYKCKRDRRAAFTRGIATCGKAGQLDEALALFGALPVAPDVTCYNVALTACRRRRDSRAALALWRRLLDDRRVKPDAISVTETVATLSDDDADTVVEEALRRGIPLTRRSISLDSDYEIDISGLPFPLARAVIRIAVKKPSDEDLVFITGVGVRSAIDPDHTSLRTHVLETLHSLGHRAEVSPSFPGSVVVDRS